MVALMIPILYGGSATTFNTNGVGRLTDAISCTVTEERNGEFSLEMVYPTSGNHYSDIGNGMIILAKPSADQDAQPFRIHTLSKPINQQVTIYADHISYDLNYIPVSIFNATGIESALSGIKSNSLETNNFTFTTDIANTDSLFQVDTPKSVRACLGGSDGSIISTFSGSKGVELKWDKFNVFATLNRGADNGVTLRYGKNITDITSELSIDDTITGVLPIWSNSDGTSVLTGTIQYSQYKDNYPVNRTVVLDCSQEFDEAPTESELNTYAYNYVNTQGLPSENISLSFVDLSKTDEYKLSASAESLSLCDTVTVIYSPLGVNFKAKVIKTEYDCLLEKYNKITIGDAKSSLAKTLITTVTEIENSTNNKLASVNIKINQQEGSLGILAQQVDETGNKLIHFQVDSANEEVRITNQSSETPTSYTSFKGDGMRIYVDSQAVAEATVNRFNCNQGLGVQDWVIQQDSNGTTLNFFRKG